MSCTGGIAEKPTHEAEVGSVRYYRLADAARQLYPVPTHPASVTRHIIRGVRLRDGSRRRLDATRTPGGWVVTAEAVRAFLDALTADRRGHSPAVPQATQTAALKAHERAEAALDAFGI
jgi:hypothetical protein